MTATGESTEERFLRDMDAPAYFGEIGLLERVPRTATVREGEGCRLWRIDGDTFLSALTESPLSASMVTGVRRGSSGPTPPTRRRSASGAGVGRAGASDR